MSKQDEEAAPADAILRGVKAIAGFMGFSMKSHYNLLRQCADYRKVDEITRREISQR